MAIILTGLFAILVGVCVVIAYESFSFLRQGQLFFRAARARLENARYCAKCGSEVFNSNARFCGRCGGQVVKAA